MKRSLIAMIEFNRFGIPFNGADICGFERTPSEEMSTRLDRKRKRNVSLFECILLLDDATRWFLSVFSKCEFN